MRYYCTSNTDIGDFIGHQAAGGFAYGPLTAALKASDVLELENSGALSALTMSKLRCLLDGLFIVETEETLRAGPGFSLVLA